MNTPEQEKPQPPQPVGESVIKAKHMPIYIGLGFAIFFMFGSGAVTSSTEVNGGAFLGCGLAIASGLALVATAIVYHSIQSREK